MSVTKVVRLLVSCVNELAPYAKQRAFKLVSEDTIWDDTITVVASVVIVGAATRVDVILVVNITTISGTQPPVST